VQRPGGNGNAAQAKGHIAAGDALNYPERRSLESLLRKNQLTNPFSHHYFPKATRRQ